MPRYVAIFLCFIFHCLPLSPYLSATTAVPLSRPYDVQNYSLEMDLAPATDPADFAAELELQLVTLDAIEKIELDTDDLTIEKVTRGGTTLGHRLLDGRVLEITFPRSLRKNEKVTLRVAYRGKVRTEQRGLFKVRDPDEPSRGPLLFTHFEPNGARAFFPANDQPFDKATSEIRVRTPVVNQVLSNGTQTAERTFRKNGEPWKEVRWKMDHPHSTYLVSLAVGPFTAVRKKISGKDISVWVGASKAERAGFALDATLESVHFFEQYLATPYPWSKYATIGLPTFMWGGMENTSATHMNQERTVLNSPSSEFEKKRIVGLVAHELAHQWFGDLVTMRWWDDIWLNEAFGSYLASRAVSHHFGNEEETVDSLLYLWNEYFRQEDGPRSHPLVDKSLSSIDDAFDAISYTKGEQVLSTLEGFIGDRAFKQGLKQYLKEFRFGNATYVDFFATMQRAAGRDLTGFRDAWLLQRGYPVVNYRGNWDAAAQKYTLTLRQVPNQGTASAVFPFRLPIAAHRRNTPVYDRATTVEFTQVEQKVELSLPAAPDWVSLNAQGVALVKIAAPEESDSALVNQASYDPDPASRVWALHQLGAPLRDGKPLSEIAQAALGNSLRQETSPYVRIAVLSLFLKMKSRWLPPYLGDVVLELARSVNDRADARTPMALSDKHGWSEWKSFLISAVGKVKKPEARLFLTGILQTSDVKIDDLGAAATAVATLGDEQSPALLREAIRLHERRGYRYRFLVESAFGAYESEQAAAAIKEMAKHASPDLLGRFSLLIRDNQTLRQSKEWAGALHDLILEEGGIGEEAKARLLSTVEEEKNRAVQDLMISLEKNSRSERIKGLAKKIREKNFVSST